MRCEVLIIKDSTLTLGEQAFAPTDIEVWNEASAHRTAMLTAAKRDITPSKSNYIPHRYKEKMTDHLSGRKRKIEQSGCAGKRCRDDEGSGRESSGRDEEEDEEDEQKSNKNHSSSDQNVNPLPADELKHQKISEMQRMKANCKTDDIDKLKYKCESLVRDCIASLLVHLSSEDFKTLEGKLYFL